MSDAGNWALENLTARILGLIILASIAVMFLVVRYKKDTWIDLADTMRLATSVAALYSGLVMVTACVVTEPPALSKLSGETVVLMGVFSFIASVYLGIRELVGVVERAGGPGS